MGNNKEQLKKLLDFIINDIATNKDNEWFVRELQERLRQKQVKPNNYIGNEIKKIREILEIRAEPSVNYSFIDNDRLRQQLIVDNLRMENSALNLKETNEFERFYQFCINAFYQIENLLNYYYYKKYPNIEDLLNHLENLPLFKRTKKEKNVSDITISIKISSFATVFYLGTEENPNYTGINIHNLRQVRNEGFHRCSFIKKEPKEKLYNFFKYQNFDSIRILLTKIVETIKIDLDKNTTKLILQKGIIKTILPSMGVVKLDNGKDIEISSRLISKFKDFKNNDKVEVQIGTEKSKEVIININKI